MITIQAALFILAAAPAVIAGICAAAAWGMSRPACPPSPGHAGGPWYPRTLSPLPDTAPLPAAALPCLQESWVQQVMAEIEAGSRTKRQEER